jgi:hypothetical protein
MEQTWYSKNKARHKAAGRAYYLKNRKKILARTLAYKKLHRKRCRQQGKEYNRKNAERLKPIRKAWARAHPDKIVSYVRAWEKRNPEWVRKFRHKNWFAHPLKNKARYAAKKAFPVAPRTCPRCGSSDRQMQRHHYKGYKNPLDIIWLCRKCHLDEHVPHRKERGSDAGSKAKTAAVGQRTPASKDET